MHKRKYQDGTTIYYIYTIIITILIYIYYSTKNNQETKYIKTIINIMSKEMYQLDANNFTMILFS